MLTATVKRVLYLIPVLFLVSLATFFMLQLIPGDPAVHIAGPNATPAQLAHIHAELGLDKPVVQRYLEWLGSVLRGDFGNTLVPPVQSVSAMIDQSFPVTLELALVAMILSLLISIPLAMVAAFRAGGRFDALANNLALAAVSIPGFLAALLLVFFCVFRPDTVRWVAVLVGVPIIVGLAVRASRIARTYPSGSRRRPLALVLGGVVVTAIVTVALWAFWPHFPRQGFSSLGSDGLGANLRSVFLPALTLALAEAAVFIRMLRNDLVGTLQEEFVLFARAKGMPSWRIMLTDALRPSSFSLITVAGVSFGRLIGGTIIVESIFNLPGMGTMIIQAVQNGDVRVVQAGVLVIAAFYVLVNSLIDISYAYLDPRVRRG